MYGVNVCDVAVTGTLMGIVGDGVREFPDFNRIESSVVDVLEDVRYFVDGARFKVTGIIFDLLVVEDF